MKKILFFLLISSVAFGQTGPYNGAPISNTKPTESAQGGLVRLVPQPMTYFDCSFAATGSGLLTTDFTQISIGSGMAVSQSGGNLVLTTGTTANSEFVARSTQAFTGTLTMTEFTILSQRIANNNFFVELVDVIGDALAYSIVNTTTVDVTKTSHGFTAQNVGQRMDLVALSSVGVPMEGVIASIPDANTIRFTVAGWPASGSGTLSLTGYNKLEVLYTGTTATNLSFNTRRLGLQNTAATVTINTTASPGHMGIVNWENGLVSIGDQLTAAGSAITNRSNWRIKIPQPSSQMYLQLRARNGTTNPASTTTWTLGMVRIEDYLTQEVNITGTRMQSNNNPFLIAGAVTLSSGTLTTLTGTTSLTPGTAAANLGKAEDNAHASADAGVFTLGVQRPGPTFTAQGASGDYSEFSVDDGGSIWTRNRPLTYSRLIADGQVKASAGHLQSITFSPTGTPAAGVITIYDSTTETGTAIFSVSIPSSVFTPFTVMLDVAATTGIFVGFDGTVTNTQVTTTFR